MSNCKDCGKQLTGHASPERCRSCAKKSQRSQKHWASYHPKRVVREPRFCTCGKKLDYRAAGELCRSCRIKEISQRPERRLKVALFAATRTDVFPHKRIIYVDRKNRLYKMRSTWEVAWAKHWDSQGLNWDYEPYRILLSTGRVYLPDFLLEGELVEVKGPRYSRESVNQAIADGYKVLVLEDIPAPASIRRRARRSSLGQFAEL